MSVSLSKVNLEILSNLKQHFLENTKRFDETLPDYSVDISKLKVSDENKKLIGASITFLHQKGLVSLDRRRVTITPLGIEELEPFIKKHFVQIMFVVFSGGLGILGTGIGVVLTLIFSTPPTLTCCF